MYIYAMVCFVCIFVRVLYMYACVCLIIHVYVYMCYGVFCLYICTCVNMYNSCASNDAYIYMYVCFSLCIYVRMYTNMCIYTNIIYTHVFRLHSLAGPF